MQPTKFLGSALLALALLVSPIEIRTPFSPPVQIGSLQPAAATILWAGGEDLDFTIYGPYVITTNTTFFRSAYARNGLSLCGNCNIQAIAPAFANQSTLWVHAQVYGGGIQTTSNSPFMLLYGSDGVDRFEIRSTGANNTVKLSKRDGSATYTDLVTCSAIFPQLVVTKFDFFINYAVSGTATLYINGVSACTYSGDVTTNSVTALKQVSFQSGSGNAATVWSEMIISTTDTRDMNLFTCQPVANGTSQTWTGTASNVNPNSITDTASINTTSSGQFANFTCPTLVTGTYTVPAVVQNARVQTAGSGPANFRYSTRPSGVGSDFDSGSDIPASGIFTNGPFFIWSTNPNTSTAWATGDFASGVNFGIKSRP